MQPWIKEVSRNHCAPVIATHPAYDATHGFLHIPKTGGTSVMTFLEQVSSSVSRLPVPLFHTWTLSLIAEYFPEMQLSFAIRDPLERLISGYHSRLRMGRPEYEVPWAPREAAAFSLYPSIDTFLNGLLDDSEYHQSATSFVMNSLSTLHWNYQYYFGSVDQIRRMNNMFFAVADVSNIKQLVQTWLDQGVVKGLAAHSIDSSGLVSQYEANHRSSRSVDCVLGEYEPDQISRIKSRLSDEYILYDELTKMINVGT